MIRQQTAVVLGLARAPVLAAAKVLVVVLALAVARVLVPGKAAARAMRRRLPTNSRKVLSQATVAMAELIPAITVLVLVLVPVLNKTPPMRLLALVTVVTETVNKVLSRASLVKASSGKATVTASSVRSSLGNANPGRASLVNANLGRTTPGRVDNTDSKVMPEPTSNPVDPAQ